MPAEAASSKPADSRKSERGERRELVYTAVRDTMMHAGWVLSSSYKFKVLSLDQRGSQFLVMIDLAREYGGDTARLNEIELLITETAKTRHDIQVTAVYWRINENEALGAPRRVTVAEDAGLASVQKALATAQRAANPTAPASVATAPAAPMATTPGATAATVLPRRPTARPAAPDTAPASARPARETAPLAAAEPSPASAPSSFAATEPRPAAPRYTRIDAEEVAAFKRALSSGGPANTPAPFGQSERSDPMRPALRPPTFADSQPTAAGSPPDLSSTQYGELR